MSDAQDVPTTHSSAQESADTSAYTLTVADVADLLHKSENTIRRLIRDGDLPAIQVQGERLREYRLREQDVEEAQARLTIQAPTHSRTRSSTQAFKRLDAHERLGASGEERALSTDVAAAGMQRLMDSIVAPLADANRRLQDANERLVAQVTEQAEELGRLREQVRAFEAATPRTEPLSASDGPTMQESLSVTAGRGSDAGAASRSHGLRTTAEMEGDATPGDLWATIAAKAAAVPEAVTQAFEVLEAAQPEEPPRRGLLARLFRRRV